jgi:MFS family permease
MEVAVNTVYVSFNCMPDNESREKRLPIKRMAVLIFFGLLMGFSHNSSPAPFIASMIEYFNLDPVTDQYLINLSLSIMFATTIPAALIGTWFEQKIGTRRLFSLAMLFVSAGILIVFMSSAGYGVYLSGRLVYGFGFGLMLPTMGSAAMKWFRPGGRRIMTTLNGLLPLLGAVLSFTLFPMAGSAYGGGEGFSTGWIFGHGFSGFIAAAVLIVWIFSVRKGIDSIDIAAEEEKERSAGEAKGGRSGMAAKGAPEASGGNVLLWNMKTNQIRCLTVCFSCEFMMYMYIATILPVWLIHAAGMAETSATFWAAVAFPVFGVIGVFLGGVLTNWLGRRRPVIIVCQVLKLVGILTASLGSGLSPGFILFGMALFGLGNGGWMPVMYIVPTEIPGASASRVAAGYSFINVCGWLTGMIGPVVGGLIATALIISSGIADESAGLAFGYKWSNLILGLFHIIAIIAAFKLKETGPKGGEAAHERMIDIA